MVKITYPGLTDARLAFEALRPFREELIRLASRCFPFGPDYLALQEAREALDRAAAHFTGEDSFYGLKIKPEPGPSTRAAKSEGD